MLNFSIPDQSRHYHHKLIEVMFQDRHMFSLIWMLTCTALVLLMQAGFTCLEAGLVRAKNSINVAIKNFGGGGGIHGQSLTLVVLDVGYEPSRTTPNTRQFIEEDHVFKMIGYARILIRTRLTIKTPITPEAVISSLECLGTFDRAFKPLHLDPSDHQASHQFWATQLKDGKVVSFDWKNLPQVFKNP